jgi:cyclopropane fatty-acyl-phospholipid synthase-like methyltransferase
MSTRTVQDEGGYNQGWAGGRSMQVRAQRRCRLLMSAMTPHPARRVLEIGCGRGEIAHQLAAETGMFVMGLDRSEQFVEEARATAPSTNIQFEALDFRQVEERLGSRQFDYVVGNGILHHLYYDLHSALLTMRNLLTDDGRIAFLEPISTIHMSISSSHFRSSVYEHAWSPMRWPSPAASR